MGQGETNAKYILIIFPSLNNFVKYLAVTRFFATNNKPDVSLSNL